MNSDETQPLINFLLSREELILILKILKTDYLPGIDVDPIKGLTKDQIGIGILYAERSLRARELARIMPDGNLAINDALLKAVAVCAFPNRSIYLHHFPADDLPVLGFGHMFDEAVIVHTLPEVGLHLFSILPNHISLVQQLMIHSKSTELQKFSADPIKISGITLSQTQEQARNEGAESVINLFIENGASATSAQILGQCLASDHNLSVLHHVVPGSNGETRKEEVTLLHNDKSAWLLSGAGAQHETDPEYILRSISRDDFQDLLLEWCQVG